MHAYLQHQHEALRAIRQELQQLREEWQAFRRQNGQPVKHEYRFDLLKVEHLQGNLHIGVRPDGNGTDIGELAVDQEPIDLNPDTAEETEAYRTIHRQIADFFKHEAAEALKAIEQKWAHPLDDAYRQFVLQDVEKQIGERIRHYLKQYGDGERDRDMSAGKWEQDILDKVKADIIATFDTFVKQMNSGGKG